MTGIRISTDLISWSDASIEYPKDLGGASATSVALFNQSKINKMVNFNGIVGGITDNGVIVSSSAIGSFNITNIDRLGFSWRKQEVLEYAPLRSIAYGLNQNSGNNIWVATGDIIISSQNTINWTKRSFPESPLFPEYPTRIAYDNNTWVLVMATKPNLVQKIKVYTSNTGIGGWTEQADITTFAFPEEVKYRNGIWFIAGDTGEIFTSTNLTTWTSQIILSGTSINSVEFGSGSWVISVGSSLRLSTDTTTWVTQNANMTNTINSIAYGNGIWTIGGGGGQLRTASSTSIGTWVTRTSNFGSTAIRSIEYTEKGWLAIGSTGTARTSVDAVTWVTQTVDSNSENLLDSLLKNDVWVVVGQGGNILTSENKISNEKLNILNIFNNSFLITSSSIQNYAITSKYLYDLNSYNLCWTTVNSNFGSIGIRSIAFGSGSWVAVGNSGQIRTSTDAMSWITQTSNFGANNIFKVAFGSGSWVAVGAAGQIRTSTNNSSWITRTSNFGTSDINSISYGNGIWVAVGDSAQIRSSTDTVTWTTRTTPIRSSSPSPGFFSFENLTDIAYNNGRWVAVGSESGIAYSDNASDWLGAARDWTQQYRFTSVDYANGYWVGGHDHGGESPPGTIVASTNNAASWVITSFTTEPILTLLYENNILLYSTGIDAYKTSNLNPLNSTIIGLATSASTYTKTISNFGSNNVLSISYGNGLWIIAGQNGVMASSLSPSVAPILLNSAVNNEYSILAASPNIIYISKDNSSRPINTGINDNIKFVSVSSSGVYKIVGERGMYESIDGFNWTTTSATLLTASIVTDIIGI